MDERTVTDEGGETAGPSPAEAHAAPSGGIDVQQLADKVYRLAMAEARLARARGERGSGHGER
jgi:hypothetical protein